MAVVILEFVEVFLVAVGKILLCDESCVHSVDGILVFIPCECFSVDSHFCHKLGLVITHRIQAF